VEDEHDDSDDTNFGRAETTSENIFPKSRNSQLDGGLLEKLGLTKERMEKGVALLLCQLLLLMDVQPKMV
jgi:hypothetical protein